MIGKRTGRRGSQAVEFALVLPVLVVLVAGIVDYGWYYSQELAVIGATREGARMGASDAAGGTDACTVAVNAVDEALAQAGFDTSGTATTTWSSTATEAISASMTTVNGENAILVRVAYPYQSLWGMVSTPSRMGASMTMRMAVQTNTTCTPPGSI